MRGLTVSGSTITVGSQYSDLPSGLNQTWYTGWNLQPFQTPSVQPSSTSYVAYYIPQNGLYEQAIGVSGTTLTTTNTAYAVSSSAGAIDPSYSYSTVAAFSSTRAVCFGAETGNNGSTFLTAYLVDYSTTTPTYLSKLQVATYSNYMCVTPLTSTTVVVTYQTPTGNICANVITMSGTSLSAGAQATVNSATTCNFNAVSALSSLTLVAYYEQTSSLQVANVLTVSGTSISVGSPTTVSTQDLGYHCVAGLSATSALVTNASGNGRMLTISGTSISAVSANQSVGVPSVSAYSAIAVISPTTVVCSGAEASGASSYTKASVVNISGTTLTPNPAVTTSEVGGVSSAFPVLLSPSRGVILYPVANMSLPFTIGDSLIALGSLQSAPCSSGGAPLGAFVLATPSGTRIATNNYSSTAATLNTRQIFSLGAAN
jgi:hypothetical protein